MKKTTPNLILDLHASAAADRDARPKLIRSSIGPMALEPRFMFDGAAAGDAVHALTSTGADTHAAVDAARSSTVDARSSTRAPDMAALLMVQPTAAGVPDNVRAAQAQAEQLVSEFLQRPDAREQLFTLFNGGHKEASAEWLKEADDFLAALRDGEATVRVELRSGAELQGAKGAFAAGGTDARPVIYLNGDWVQSGADVASIESVLVEEFGHAIDARLNSGGDSVGDEGERFAAAVVDGSVSDSVLAHSLSNEDHATLRIDGKNVDVELAGFSFINAYEVTTSLGHEAGKESNTHDFVFAGLGQVTVNDASNSATFSGNDVSATSIVIGGETLNGWISRPIKVGGVVKGFYFWTDAQFTSLAAAQADGNQDSDANVLDNRGFILVVDQSYFTNLGYLSGSGTTGIKNVGSSSDRVDTALNALLVSNVAPVANNDNANGALGNPGAALEQGYNANTSAIITPTVPATGNVLTNDTDGNADSLSVSKVVSKTTGASALPSGAGAFTVAGTYGTLTIYANGTYSYAVNNAQATVDALLSGNISEAFTYTASDAKGGTATATLTVQINGSNDAPVASNDYNVAKEITTTSNTGYTATAGALPDANNVLANDTDVDTGDTKTVTGSSVSGNATANVAVTAGTYSFTFTGSLGFSTGNSVFVELGQVAPGTNGTVYAGLYTRSGSNYTLVTVTKNSSTGTLSSTPTYYYNPTSNTFVAITDVTAFFATYKYLAFSNYTDSNLTTGDTITETSSTKTQTISSTSGSGYTTLSGLSSQSGTIAVGMTVTGTGVLPGTTVTDVTLTSGVVTSIKLSSDQVTSTNGTAFTFTGASGVATTLTGQHGTLVLQANGSYVYTPFTDNPKLISGDVATEVFDYTMRDAAGVTSAAKLYITVYGSGSNDTAVVNDTGTAYESGVGRDGSNALTNDNTAYIGANASGNVLTNDGATNTPVVSLFTKADGSSSTAAGSTMTASYGTLTIAANGAFTYLVANGNSTVNALLPGSTLTETFVYKVTNSVSGTSFARLVVTITGTNDQPVAVADTAAVQEDGTLLATGNVLGNDTDVDSGDTKVVSNAGTSSAGTPVTGGTTSANGLSITGTYGTLILGADGTYSYTLNNAAANVQALAQGATANDVFTYEVRDTNGATHTNSLTITVTGANEAPINQFNGTAISSTATTSITTAVNTAIDFTGSKLLSVADSDTNLTSITLAVEHGVLSFTSTPGVVTLSAASGTSIRISAGTQAQLNAALALLRYTPDGGFYGTDFLTIHSQDGANASDSDGIAINIPTNTTATVSEPALGTGSNPTSGDEVTTGTLTLAGGQSILSQQTGNIRDGSNNAIGTWQVNTDGTFSVTLTAASSATSTSFSYVVIDSYGNTVNNTVTVSITDDGPTATANTRSVNEGSTVSGNVLSNGIADTFGADGAKTTSPAGGVVGVRAAGGDTSTAVTTGTASAITGLYGTLTLNADGSYSYVANSNSVTTAQNDVFVYTIEDADGTRSTATLTITVNDAATQTITVTGKSDVSEGSNAVFTVDLSNASASATEITLTLGAGGDTAVSADYSSTMTAYYYVGLVRSELPITAGKISLPAGVTSFFVSVPTTADTPKVLEGAENFTLAAAITAGASDSDTATIVDDGSGKVYTDKGVIDPAGTPDDDRPQFVPLVPPPAVPPTAPPPPAPQPPTVVPYVPPPAFESSLLLTKPSSLPLPDRPSIGDILTSPVGYRATVIEAPQAALTVYRGVTDQFVEAGRATSFNLPNDAFAHTRPEAVLTIEVKLADGRPLPSWIHFDPQSGSFSVNAPRGYAERLVIRITVRDGQGLEATAMFKLDVGNGKPRLTGRTSLSDQLRVAGQRPGSMLNVGRDPAPERAAAAAARVRV